MTDTPVPVAFHNSKIGNVYIAKQESALNQTKKKDITIMLIGEIGCGKTAFMSLLVNLLMGNKTTELVGMHDLENESETSETQSRTKTTILYEVTSLDGTHVRIIDTPGLADARGIDTDGERIKATYEVVQSISSIDAVFILVDGTKEQAPIDTIKAILPRSIIQNIGFILTHCDITSNFQVNNLEGDLGKCKEWWIQNPIVSYKDYLQKKTEHPTNQKMHKEMLDYAEDQYSHAVESLNESFTWLDSCNPHPAEEVTTLHQMLIDIEGQIHSMFSQQAEMKFNRMQLELIDPFLKRVELICSSLKDQLSHSPIPDDLPHTVCGDEKCRFVPFCHSPCAIPGSLSAEVPITCQEVHGQGKNCTVCNHPSEAYSTRVQTYKYPLKDVLSDSLKKCETDLQEITHQRDLLTRPIREIEGIIKKIFGLTSEFNSFSLCGAYADHLKSIIRLLKERKNTLESKEGTEKDREIIDKAVQKVQWKLEAVEEAEKGSR